MASKLLIYAINQAIDALRQDAKRSEQRADDQYRLANELGIDQMDNELRIAIDEGSFARGLATGIGSAARRLEELAKALAEDESR